MPLGFDPNDQNTDDWRIQLQRRFAGVDEDKPPAEATMEAPTFDATRSSTLPSVPDDSPILDTDVPFAAPNWKRDTSAEDILQQHLDNPLKPTTRQRLAAGLMGGAMGWVNAGARANVLNLGPQIHDTLYGSQDRQLMADKLRVQLAKAKGDDEQQSLRTTMEAQWRDSMIKERAEAARDRARNQADRNKSYHQQIDDSKEAKSQMNEAKWLQHVLPALQNRSAVMIDDADPNSLENAKKKYGLGHIAKVDAPGGEKKTIFYPNTPHEFTSQMYNAAKRAGFDEDGLPKVGSFMSPSDLSTFNSMLTAGNKQKSEEDRMAAAAQSYELRKQVADANSALTGYKAQSALETLNQTHAKNQTESAADKVINDARVSMAGMGQPVSEEDAMRIAAKNILNPEYYGTAYPPEQIPAIRRAIEDRMLNRNIAVVKGTPKQAGVNLFGGTGTTVNMPQGGPQKPQAPPPQQGGRFSVPDPTGKIHYFNSQAEADTFRKLLASRSANQ